MNTHARKFFRWVGVLAILGLAVANPGPVRSTQSLKDKIRQPDQKVASQPRAVAIEAEIEALKSQLTRKMQEINPTPSQAAEIRELEIRLGRLQKELVGMTTQAEGEAVAAVVPPNDNCAVATSITSATCPLIDRQSTAQATNEPGEPETTCGSVSTPTQSNSVWYKFTNNSGSGRAVTASTAGSDYDTVVQVYTGGCGAFNRFCCDDDSGPGDTSELTFWAEPGTSYLIKVADWGGAGGGRLVFILDCRSFTMANDFCRDATQVMPTKGQPLFQECLDTTLATRECGEEVSGASVWYRVTAPLNGVLDLSTFGSGADGASTNYDTTIFIYDATTCLPRSTDIIAYNDDFKGDLRSRVAAIVSAGQTVLVRVGAYGDATGTLCVRFLFTPTCP